MADSTINPSANVNESVSGANVQNTFKVYKPPTDIVSTLPDLPDSYFTPSASELMSTQASLSARTQTLADAPLLTRAAREVNDKKKLDRWPTTTIRVKFSDRTQLEKSFASTEKIRSVYAFVRNSLREDVKPIKFILYQPPKRELKVSDASVRDLTLAQLQLAPSSVLLLKFLDDGLNGPGVTAPLDPSIVSQAVDLPQSTVPAESSGTITNESRAPKVTSSTTTGEKKIPKWFKMGQKK